MKTIPLNRGKVALVDDADYVFLSQWKWTALKPKGATTFYAVRGTTRNGRSENYRMHQELVDVPLGKEIDHRNGDGLDNRRGNLRVCDQTQNRCNRGPHRDNQHGVKGVYRHWRKWAAHIQYRGEHKYLGLFPTLRDAALAYDRAARVLHGEFAWTNEGHGLV